MKKIITLGVSLVLISTGINFYVTNYFCRNDDYCLYKISDGVTENLVYLSCAFLAAALISLIGKNSRPWLIVFGILTIIFFLTPQTCAVVGCFNKDILLIVAIFGTVFVALITNLVSKFRK